MRALRLFAKLLGYALLALFALFALYQFSVFVQILYWVKHNPRTTSIMEERLEALREKNPTATLRQQWVDYARISVNLKRAVVAAEDARFVEHDGFDWEGMEKALEKNQRRGHIVAGGSTITQQLAKNLFLSGERTLARKGEEAIITAMLEATMSKRRILELYLNLVEWGDGVFGAEAAARHYFGVSAAALSAEQAARLAGMLPRPRFYDRNRGSPYLAQYAQTILARMPSAQIP